MPVANEIRVPTTQARLIRDSVTLARALPLYRVTGEYDPETGACTVVARLRPMTLEEGKGEERRLSAILAANPGWKVGEKVRA